MNHCSWLLVPVTQDAAAEVRRRLSNLKCNFYRQIEIVELESAAAAKSRAASIGQIELLSAKRGQVLERVCVLWLNVVTAFSLNSLSLAAEEARIIPTPRWSKDNHLFKVLGQLVSGAKSKPAGRHTIESPRTERKYTSI
jgi:hypothetical protein